MKSSVTQVKIDLIKESHEQKDLNARQILITDFVFKSFIMQKW